MRVLRVLLAARGCVPMIDAVLFYLCSQRGNDVAVVFCIILAAHIPMITTTTRLRSCHPLAPRASFQAFLGYGYPSSFCPMLVVLMIWYSGCCGFVHSDLDLGCIFLSSCSMSFILFFILHHLGHPRFGSRTSLFRFFPTFRCSKCGH